MGRGAVVASDAGFVLSLQPSKLGGNQIKIWHKDGSVSGYAHTAASVKLGVWVSEGQVIGRTDLSGNSEAPHVHYTFRLSANASPVDPLSHLPRRNNYPVQGPSLFCLF